MSCFKQNRPSDLIREDDWSKIDQPTLMGLFLLPETTNEMRIEILNKALNTIKCVYLENGFTLEEIGSNIDKANNSLKEAFENPTPETVAFIPSALGSFVGARDLDAIVAEYKRNTRNKNVTTKQFLSLALLLRGGRIFDSFISGSAETVDNQALADAIKVGNKVDAADYELSGGTKKKKKDGGMMGYPVWLWGGVAVALGGAYLLMRKK